MGKINFSDLKHGIGDYKTVRNYYNDWSKDYDKVLKKWNYTAPYKVAQVFHNKIKPFPKKILDLACGTGLVAEELNKFRKVNIDGADLSDKSLKTAYNKKIYNKLFKFNFQKKITSIKNKYQAILCVGSITYCDDFSFLLNELKNITSNGGYFIFTHRNDLWKKQNFLKIINHSKDWNIFYIGKSIKYLPGNKDFGDKIKMKICILKRKNLV